jgi:uncharacterized repeat protein (TIGR01451 family)
MDFSHLYRNLGLLWLAFLWFVVLLSAVKTTAQSVVDHFSWGAVPTTVQAGFPISALVQARDFDGGLFTNFNGEVSVTELIPSQIPHLLITEVQTVNTQRVELSNLSSSPVGVSGWRVVLYDRLSWPAPKVTFIVPTGTVVPESGAFQVRGSASTVGAYPVFSTGVSLAWTSSSMNNQVAVLLLDAEGKVIDFFCAVDAYPGFIAVPTAITDRHWNGVPVAPNNNAALTFQRGGRSDHNNAADWAAATNSIGVPNSRLQVPLVATPSQVALVPLSVSLTNGGWSGQLVITAPGTNIVLHADDGIGHAGDSTSITVLGLPLLRLQVPPEAFKATPGLTGQGSVSVPQVLSSNLVVTLSTDLPDSITLPPIVTISAGTTNVVFAVSNLDNGLLEGPRVATMVATASGLAPGSAVITNYDRQMTVLTVSLPSSVPETSGWLATGQARSSLPVSRNVAVRLTSSHTNILVPDFAIIPAGQTTASFGFAVLDNSFIGGNQSATISANVPGWVPAQTQILIVENESTNLALTLPSQVNEGGLLTNASVQLAGQLLTNLTVTLTTDTPSLLQVPMNVVIPAGQTSAVFNVTISNNLVPETNTVVRVTASAGGFLSGTRNVTVIDNDVSSFSFSTLPAAQIAGQQFQVTVSALNQSGNVVAGYTNMVNQRADGFLGDVLVVPSSVGPFTNGVWSGFITVPSPDRGLFLTVYDSLGHSGSSVPFDVVAARVLSLPVADLAYDTLRNNLLAGVVSNAAGNGQSVIAIDPGTGGLGTPIFIGNDPSKLALANDFSCLYVSQEVNSTGGVVRIDLSSQAVDLRFALGTLNQYGQSVNYVEDMKVQPGNAHTLVATTKIRDAYNQFIAVYDNGVQRSNVVSPVFYVLPYHITFADSPSYFYITKPNGLWINSITLGGASFLREIAGPQYGADVVYADGRLYSTSGEVFSTNDFQTVGTFPANGLVIPDPANARVYFLTQAGAVTTFRSFEQHTFLPIAQLNIPNVSGQPASFVKCGANRFAFRTAANQLCIFDSSLLYTNSTANLSVQVQTSPAQPVMGSNLVYSISISNAGPATSFGTVLTNQIPTWSSFVSATSTLGNCNHANGVVTALLGQMTNGAVAGVTIVVRPDAGGAHLNLTRVRSLAFDPDQTDNLHADVQTVLAISTNSAVTPISLPSNDIVFDPVTQRIWASVPMAMFGLSNCLASLDPIAGRVESVVAAGRQPTQLAISPTGQHLYVGLNGDSRVQRFDTVAQTLSSSFFVGTNIGAYHLDVLPGAPQTLAVSRYTLLTGVRTSVAIYDNGVQRPLTIGAARIQFSADGTRLYGSDGAGGYFSINSVGAGGLTLTGAVPLAFHFPVEMSVVGHQAYYGSGYVVDFTSGTYGQQFSPIGYASIACVDESANRIFFLWSDSQNWFLQQFDLVSHALEASLMLPPLLANPQDLIRWGTNGLAFRNDSNQVFLVQIPLIPKFPQLSVSQSAFPELGSVGSNLTYTVVVTNRGPVDAHNVVLTDTLPVGATFVSAFSPQGSITQDASNVSFVLGTVSNNASVTLQCVVSPTIGGWNTNTSTVVADSLDSSSGQNSSKLSHWVNLGPTTSLVNQIMLQGAADIIYNASNQTILASIVTTGGAYSNSIVAIDARHGAAVLQIPVGDQPSRLALSDDNQYLYTALASTGGVARINLASNFTDLTFGLGIADSFGFYTAGDLKVVPGQPSSLAVSINHGQSNEGVAIYDDSERRTNASPGREFGGTYFISFGSTPATMYSTLPFYFRTISVNASGAQLVDEATGLVPGYDAAFEFDDGRIYFQTGRVIDPVSKTIVGALPANGLVAPDSANGRIYFVTSTGFAPFNWQLTLRALDPSTSNELWSAKFPIASGGATRLIKCGTNGLAVLTDANRLFLVRTPQLATPTSDLTMSVATSANIVSAGAPLTYTLTVQNDGPWTASGVSVSNMIPSGAIFDSASSTRGSCTFTNGSVLCALGSLSNTASATITINLTAPAGVSMTNFAMVRQDGYDPSPSNDSKTVVTAISSQPRISIRDAIVLEGVVPGNATVSFTITLSTPSSTTVSVGYQTADGTAIAGQDYSSASGVTSFNPGVTNRQLNLSIIRSNPSIGPTSFFYLNLVSATNATIERTPAVATIVNRVFRTISVTGGSLLEGNAGLTNAQFKFTLSSTSSLPVSVQYQTIAGTAVSGTDFAPKVGMLTIPPGTTNGTLSVPVFSDTVWEPDKTLFLHLSQPQNAILLTNETVATILNDDPVPVLVRLDYNVGSDLILTWEGQYVLQAATNVIGPYVDVPTAISPYTNLLGTEPRLFFRLRASQANE